MIIIVVVLHSDTKLLLAYVPKTCENHATFLHEGDS